MKLPTKQSTRKILGKVSEKSDGIPPDVLERLLALLEVRKVRQVDLATAMKRSKDWASRTMSGERGLSVTTLIKLTSLYSVDLHWLLTGEGSMVKRSESVAPTDAGELVDDLVVRLRRLREVIRSTDKKPGSKKRY